MSANKNAKPKYEQHANKEGKHISQTATGEKQRTHQTSRKQQNNKTHAQTATGEKQRTQTQQTRTKHKH